MTVLVNIILSGWSIQREQVNDEMVAVQLFLSWVTWTKHCVCTFVFLSLGWWKCLLFSYNNYGVKTMKSCLCSILSFISMSLTENMNLNVDKQLHIYISLQVISLQMKIYSSPDCVAIVWLWLLDHINIRSALFCLMFLLNCISFWFNMRGSSKGQKKEETFWITFPVWLGCFLEPLISVLERRTWRKIPVIFWLPLYL